MGAPAIAALCGPALQCLTECLCIPNFRCDLSQGRLVDHEAYVFKLVGRS